MTLLCCNNRRNCTGIAVIVSLIIGIVAAFLQITGTITLTPIFSVVAFGIAVIYLAVTLIATALVQRNCTCEGVCFPLYALLAGILGTILTAVVLLAITFAATSVIGAIIVGVLFFSFSLLITSTACLAKCFINCSE